MSVRLMVLGALESSKKAHGYKIYRQINDWRAETWTSIKPGSVYHALTTLEKAGYIDNVGLNAKSKGPSATSYLINNSGRAELQRLIEQALISYDQEEFAAGLAWMHLLSREKVIALAAQRLAQYKETCRFMRTLPRETNPSRPDKHPEIIDSWTVLFDATAQWMQDFISHLNEGQYRFLGE